MTTDNNTSNNNSYSSDDSDNGDKGDRPLESQKPNGIDASEMIAAINKMLKSKASGGGEAEYEREYEAAIKEMEGFNYMSTLVGIKDVTGHDINKLPTMLMDILSGSATLTFTESEQYRKHPIISVLGNKPGVSEAVTSVGPLMGSTPETLRKLQAQVSRLVAQIDLNSGRPQAQMASIAIIVKIALCMQLLMAQLAGVMGRHEGELEEASK